MHAPPFGVGVGFKPAHYRDALASPQAGLWLEVHPENYMVDGGPRRRMLRTLAERFPLSLHGVSMSLGGAQPLDPAHLARLAALNRELQPALVSEHLAFSRLDGHYEPDLLPLLRTDAQLQVLVRHVQQVQERLGRTIAVEHPAHMLALEDHAYDEISFLDALCRRTGCQVLLDVNNVAVSAANLGFDPVAWVERAAERLPIAEVHVAGHRPDPVLGDALLIDSHDREADAGTWALYHALVQRTGPLPTCFEWDVRTPPFAELLQAAAPALAMARQVELA
jgi:uncharacterized protein (UPF0276 family)